MQQTAHEAVGEPWGWTGGQVEGKASKGKGVPAWPQICLVKVQSQCGAEIV